MEPQNEKDTAAEKQRGEHGHPTGDTNVTGGSIVPYSARVGAFFDLDKTIIATSSAYAFGREFLHNGLISPSEALQLSLAKASYMFAGQSSQQMDGTRDQLMSMIAGWSEEQVRDIAKDTLHNVVTPTIYAEARDLIEKHKQAGHQVVIISASARILVELIAAELGVDHVVATELETRDGHFTGEVLYYCKGATKAAAVAELASDYGIDLSASFAYSDSATDIPMLERVGHPVAVNPDRAMKKHALEHGWAMSSFRNPVPLFTMPNAKEVGIGASVVAGVAALIAGGIWLARTPRETLLPWMHQRSRPA